MNLKLKLTNVQMYKKNYANHGILVDLKEEPGEFLKETPEELFFAKGTDVSSLYIYCYS